MSRKREAASPALILFSNVEGIPKQCIIDSPNFLVGRGIAANFSIAQRHISRRECTFSYDAITEKWSIESHSRKAICVQGKTLKANDSTTLECGDKIKFTADIIYEFKCSPSEDGKCCMDFKKVRLSNDVEETNKDEDGASVLNVNTEGDVELVSVVDESNVVNNEENDVSVLDDLNVNNEGGDIALASSVPYVDDDDDVFSLPITNKRKPDSSLDKSSMLPSTLPISQLPDSTSNEFRNSSDDFNSYSITEVTEVTDTCSYVDSKPASLVGFDSLPGPSSNLEISLSDNINDLETQIQNYGNNNQLGFDGKTSIDQELKDELNRGLEYIRKLAEMNSSCEAYFSDPSDEDALSSIKDLSSYFQTESSKLNYRNEKTFYNKPDENLYRIILNMNTILKEKTQSAMGFLPQFLESAPNKEPVKEFENTQNILDDVFSDNKPQSQSSQNREEHEKLVREKNDLQAENEKYKEEIRKMKDNMSWHESRIKFLELKVKEKEKLEIDLENQKEETESLEKENADLKRSLANLEIMELEYKNILETNKYREEDKRNKDALQRTISTLESQLKVMKDENAQLVNDKCLSQDEITKLKEKCNDLEEKVKEKIIAATKCVSSCGGDNSSGEDYCCDMVKEVKSSLIDLMEREFQCSICGEMLVESTVTNCNHIFCSFCLQEWKKKQKKCPFCRAALVKEVRATIIDDYITGFLKIISDRLHSERMSVINDRQNKKAPAPTTAAARGGRSNRRNSRQPAAIVDLS